jgi:hypothetical protein
MSTAIPESSAGAAGEVAILGRLLLNGKRGLTRQRARDLLELQFSEPDQARINDLAARNQQGLLSEEEKAELLAYAKAGCLLGILHSRARRVLGKGKGRSRSGKAS